MGLSSMKLHQNFFLSVIVLLVLEYSYQEKLNDLKELIRQKQMLRYFYNGLTTSTHLEVLEQQQIAAFQDCLESDYQKLIHPDVILQDIYVWRPVTSDGIGRSVAINFFQVYQSKGLTGTQEHHPFIQIKSGIYEYVNNSTNLTPGLSSLCLLQKRHRISHDISSTKKYQIASKQTILLQKMIANNATEQCIKEASFQTKSFILDKELECKEIIQILKQSAINGVENKFIVKTEKHTAKGVFVLTHNLIKKYLSNFKNGTQCGKIKTKDIIQKYVNNPLLYWGHKVELRFYLIVVQIEPLIVYFHRFPSSFRCIKKYNESVFETISHICNPYTASRYWGKTKHPNKNYLSVEDVFLNLTLEEYGDYLFDARLIKNKEWINSSFIPMIQRKISYLFTHSLRFNVTDPRVFQLFTIDTMLDQNLDLHIIDVNWDSSVKATIHKAWMVQKVVHRDTQLLLREYLRMRYNRIKDFIKGRLEENQFKVNEDPPTEQDIKNVIYDVPIKEQLIHNFYLVPIPEMSCFQFIK